MLNFIAQALGYTLGTAGAVTLAIMWPPLWGLYLIGVGCAIIQKFSN